jgi:uncharacterized protein YciI
VPEMPPNVAIEPVYVIEATYAADAAERRPAVRAEHLTRIAELRDQGVVIEAGGYADLSVAILIVRAANEDEALALARSDVYMRSGVWVDARAKPYGRVVRPADLRAS